MRTYRKLIIDLQTLSDGTPMPMTPREVAVNLIGLCRAVGATPHWESNRTFVINLNPGVAEQHNLFDRLSEPLKVEDKLEPWRGHKILVRHETRMKIRAVE